MSADSIIGTSLQQALFKYADKNKDGGISASELKTVAGALTGSANPSDSDVASLMTALDGNKDGKLSQTEFLQASVAQANNASLLDGGTMAALLGGDSSNPYSALTGYSSSTNPANLYSSLVNSSLGASTQAGALTASLEYGALTAKDLLV
jgi:hypothetical protein